MASSLDVRVELSGLDSMMGGRALANAQKLLAERVAQDDNRYVMVDTGALHDSMVVGDDSVTWPEEYAGYALNADSAKTAKNPNARVQWPEFGKSMHQRQWEEYVGDILSGGA